MNHENQKDSKKKNIIRCLNRLTSEDEQKTLAHQEWWNEAEVFAAKEISEKKAEFESKILEFSTDQHSHIYKRKLITTEINMIVWTKLYFNLIKNLAETSEQWERVAWLLYTWKDLFVIKIRDMSATDMIEHQIFMYHNIISKIV